MGDWIDHMTTVFPEVRLKRFLEMRGADGGPWRRLCALPAYWVGLLYDGPTLDAAWDLVKDWTEADHRGLRDTVPRLGLSAPFGRGTVKDVALETLALSRAGLQARARLDRHGRDESIYLETLQNIAASGRTPAEDMVSDFEGRWGGNVDEAYRDYVY